MLKYLYPFLEVAGIQMKDEPNIKNAASAAQCDMCGEETPSSSSWVINSHAEWFIDGIPKICTKCGQVLNGIGKLYCSNIYKNLSGGKRVIVYSDGNACNAIFNFADIFKQKPGAFFFFYSGRLTLDPEKIIITPMPEKNVFVNFYNHSTGLRHYDLFPGDEIPAYAKKGYMEDKK